ncbi:hypothetical protein PtB15_12B244 [Puccinia triticina]|nr:hypothetical protein PtB15_12B244 [Puccinia triticina]
MSGNRTPNHPVHMTTLVKPLADCSGVEGLGIVIKREEVVVNLETRLEVIVEHTDWDSQVNDCSITSGHQIGRAKSSGSPVKSNPHGKGRNLVKLNSDENIPSTSTPSGSPAKKMFDTPASSYCASDRNGKRKATEPMETDNEESYENGGGEDKDEEEEPKEKPTRGRPRKAILKDAAKRLKKL